MKLLRFTLMAASAGLVIAFLFTRGCANEVPKAYVAALRSGTDFVLLSTEPRIHRRDPVPADEAFHGWEVLGRAVVTDDGLRRRLAKAFESGVRWHDGTVAACFDPRHGISVEHEGRRYDFVICFSCMQVRVYVDGERASGLSTSRRPLEAFDEAFTELGLPRAGS